MIRKLFFFIDFLQWENPLPTSWEGMVRAERIAKGTLLAH